MDRILNFVALRAPTQRVTAAPELAAETELQQELAAGAPATLDAAIAAAQAFVDSGQFVSEADQLDHGVPFLDLVEQLSDDTERTLGEIKEAARNAAGEDQPADWAGEAGRARDSVLAAYLLPGSGLDANTASKFVRACAIVEAVLAGGVSPAQITTLLRAPLVLPDSLLGLREHPDVTADAPPDPDETARALLARFQATREEHARLTETLTHINSHDEDELLLSELGQQRPLAEMYRGKPQREEERQVGERRTQRKLADLGETAGGSPLRRAALRSNVIFSETAVSLLPETARATLQRLELDPASATIQQMVSAVSAAQQIAANELHTMGNDLGQLQVEHVYELSDAVKQTIAGFRDKMGLYPIDDPTPVEPVAKAPPLAHNAVRPLGTADLLVVRGHISRYERGEVASLENILAGEKLTHSTRQVNELETTDTSDSEQTSLQGLAQATAEQSAGKTTAQSVGAGRGPLTSDGPQSFSKSVTDQVSASSSSRNRRLSISRRLRRDEEALEHIFDNANEPDGSFGVYQWLNKVYQAQVFNYGSRLLYDIIIPEPAALFREALARPRSQAVLPPRPAKFTLAADRLDLFNWSYYATGHQATGVEAPPQAQIIVTENFGRTAGDPNSSDLSAATLEIGETRITRIPKGYKATGYRLIARASGWTAFVLRAIIGAKSVFIDGSWDRQAYSGKLDAEVESLPVGLIVDGDGSNRGISTLAIGIEIICEPTQETISAWQTKTHAQILAANQRRFADYEERAANRDASARLQLQSFSDAQKAGIIQNELKRTALAVLTNQNFSSFNANQVDTMGFPYPNAASTTALAPYIRFFEQAVEWQYLQCAFFPYFWGSRGSWMSKMLSAEKNTRFAEFLSSGAARVILAVRPGYEVAVEHFLNSGTIPTTDELLDVGGRLWVALVDQLREQQGEGDVETAVGEPWEFRIASDLVRARRDGLLPKWTLSNGEWVEEPDPTS